jgi:hypothetical protein
MMLIAKEKRMGSDILTAVFGEGRKVLSMI